VIYLYCIRNEIVRKGKSEDRVTYIQVDATILC